LIGIDFNLLFCLQQSEPTSLDPPIVGPTKQEFHSFVKILTASDTSTHGGFSVLRKHATECLPALVNIFLKKPSQFKKL